MNNKVIVSIAVIVIAFGLGAIVWQFVAAAPTADAAPLAACLKQKGITMYGAYWCPHCQNQKKMFGSAFSQVPYVECAQEVDRCTAAKVESYPTWIFPDGTRHVGEYKTLDDLAKESGCPAPVAK